MSTPQLTQLGDHETDKSIKTPMLTSLHNSCYDDALLVVILDKTFMITLIQAKVFGDCNDVMSLGFKYFSKNCDV